MELTKLEIKLRKVSDIIPFLQNPKTHPQSQLDKLKEGILKFGFTQPILIDSEGVIIAGHARREAALQMGLKEVPTITLDLPPEKVAMLRLYDNRIPELGGTDLEMLQFNLEELLKIDGIDIELTGYDKAEIDALLNINNNFSFDLGGEEGTEGGTEERKGKENKVSCPDGEPEDFKEVEGERAGISYSVFVSFTELEDAEDFLTRIGWKVKKFVPGKFTTVVDGDQLPLRSE